MPDAVRRNGPLLLGHRGARARKSIPENTVASFDQALADGCDGFEFDVRLTADGAAVICHDPEFAGLEIASVSAHQLRCLLQLEDLLARYCDRAFLDIELKVQGLEKSTLALLGKYPPRRGFVVSSFLPEVLHVLHEEAPALPLGLICETRAELRVWRELPLKCIIAHYELADIALLRELKSARKRLLVWTVNEPMHMVRFRHLGVDGIISDDTDLLCRTLGS
jgi:glycerophosphoryl diester phosphodiesterase